MGSQSSGELLAENMTPDSVKSIARSNLRKAVNDGQQRVALVKKVVKN